LARSHPCLKRQGSPARLLKIGTNYDERVRVKLNQVILKGNEIVWKEEGWYSVDVTKKFVQNYPKLEPGTYRRVYTLSSGDSLETFSREITVLEEDSSASFMPEPAQTGIAFFDFMAWLISSILGIAGSFMQAITGFFFSRCK
jgi:hypothetical protein